MPGRSSLTSRRGLTLIELVVVLAVIGLMAAVLLPAIQAARGAARRAQCASRLRQLGLSLHAYHTKQRSFPAGLDTGWSWQARILPEMEQYRLYQQYDFRHHPFEKPNSHRLDSRVHVLLCPSDPYSENTHRASALGGVRFAHTNYLGSLANGVSRGMFPYERGIGIAQVSDGASQTLFVGERGIVFDGVNTHGWWPWGAATTIAASQPFQGGSYEDPAAILHWWSYHPGGAHFLLVDGSVHFLTYNMDSKAFAALGTRDAGDIARL